MFEMDLHLTFVQVIKYQNGRPSNFTEMLRCFWSTSYSSKNKKWVY